MLMRHYGYRLNSRKIACGLILDRVFAKRDHQRLLNLLINQGVGFAMTEQFSKIDFSKKVAKKILEKNILNSRGCHLVCVKWMSFWILKSKDLRK